MQGRGEGGGEEGERRGGGGERREGEGGEEGRRRGRGGDRREGEERMSEMREGQERKKGEEGRRRGGGKLTAISHMHITHHIPLKGQKLGRSSNALSMLYLCHRSKPRA